MTDRRGADNFNSATGKGLIKDGRTVCQKKTYLHWALRENGEKDFTILS